MSFNATFCRFVKTSSDIYHWCLVHKPWTAYRTYATRSSLISQYVNAYTNNVYLNSVSANQSHIYFQNCLFTRNLPVWPSSVALVSTTAMDRSDQKTAAIIIIGDEIIKGHVQDCNSHFLCQRLYHLGVDVQVIKIIPDNIDSIASTVKKYSKMYTYVITSGGIGPTHDDITFDAVAKAFNDESELRTDLEQLYKSYFKDKYTNAHQKLATIPKSAKLVRNNVGFPVVSMNNVFVLPGVPKFLKMAFSVLEDTFRNPMLAYNTVKLFISMDEMTITPILTRINQQYKNTVAIGSYPEYHNNYYKVKLVLESKDINALQQCEQALKAELPPDSIINFVGNPLTKAESSITKLISNCSPISNQLKKSMDILGEALKLYRLDEICIGFNGGKDCTALLHMLYAAVSQHLPEEKQQITALYIRSKTPFPEVEKFIEESIRRYNLNMLRYGGSIKDQLREMKNEHTNIKAVIMGTRHCDPHGSNLGPFQMTDNDWPQLMRVNPILHWSYNDVWYFLRHLCLPYCSLYDVGYTSLGSMENTHPNPALRYTDSSNVVHYYPAYTLVASDHHLERAGRTVNLNSGKPSESNS